jgi:hypothetical protein
MTDERRELTQIITPLVQIFQDKRRCPSTLTLACKCLTFLVSRDSDKKNRIKLVEEGEIIKTIAEYLDLYDYEEKLILCCLDLFSYVLPEASLKIYDYLYGVQERLIVRLKKFLKCTDVPGTYYSQRVKYFIKYLTLR